MEYRMVREAGPLKFNSGGPFVNACLPPIQDFLVRIHKEDEQHCTDGEDVGQNAGHRDILLGERRAWCGPTGSSELPIPFCGGNAVN